MDRRGHEAELDRFVQLEMTGAVRAGHDLARVIRARLDPARTMRAGDQAIEDSRPGSLSRRVGALIRVHGTGLSAPVAISRK